MEETPEESSEEITEDVLEEIEESVAEDAEDTDNHRRHHIPILDYHSMSMENLVGELQRLVRNEKVQAIKKHADGIKYEFDLKFQEFLENKKEKSISDTIPSQSDNSTKSIKIIVKSAINTTKV